MEAISMISIQVDSSNKEIANKISKNLGLNMSTFVNVVIKQLIYTNSLPFDVKTPRPSKELLVALEEGEDILNGDVEAKEYHNINDLLENLKNKLNTVTDTKYEIKYTSK